MAKATKKEAQYRYGKPRQNCGTCQMFRSQAPGPKGSICTAVEGDISAYGLCKFVEPRINPFVKGKGGVVGG